MSQIQSTVTTSPISTWSIVGDRVEVRQVRLPVEVRVPGSLPSTPGPDPIELLVGQALRCGWMTGDHGDPRFRTILFPDASGTVSFRFARPGVASIDAAVLRTETWPEGRTLTYAVTEPVRLAFGQAADVAVAAAAAKISPVQVTAAPRPVLVAPPAPAPSSSSSPAVTIGVAGVAVGAALLALRRKRRGA